jgi:hypothetical protein
LPGYEFDHYFPGCDRFGKALSAARHHPTEQDETTVLAYRLNVWAALMNAGALRLRHRAALLQNHHLPEVVPLVAAAVPAQPLATVFFWVASVMQAMKVQYPVDLQRRPNPSETFWRQELRVLVSRPRLAGKVSLEDVVVFGLVLRREPHRANLQDSPRGHYFQSCFSVFLLA